MAGGHNLARFIQRLRGISRRRWIAALVTCCMLFSFALLAALVSAGGTVTQFDLLLAQTIFQNTTPLGVTIFWVITQFGSGWALALIGFVMSVVLLLRGWRSLTFVWIAGLIGGGLLNLTLKAWLQRPRPIFDVPIMVAQGWSFPSGHTMNAIVGYGLLAYLLCTLTERSVPRVALIITACMLMVLIGFSRMYLGVHYLSDVLAGYAAGGVWLFACISWMQAIRHRLT